MIEIICIFAVEYEKEIDDFHFFVARTVSDSCYGAK